MNINILQRTIILSGIILFLFACSANNSDTNEGENNDQSSEEKLNTKDILKITDMDMFRKIDLNDSTGKIKLVEDTSALKKENEKEITYEYIIDDKNSYEIIYSFDKSVLYRIDMTAYFNKKNAETLLKDMKKAYTPKCKNIIDKDMLLTMDSKDNLWFVDIDYVDINKGIIEIRFTENNL